MVVFLSLLAFQAEAQSDLTITFVDSVQTSCQNDASATIAVSGGQAPYTAYWIIYSQTTPPGPGTDGIDTVAVGTFKTGHRSKRA